MKESSGLLLVFGLPLLALTLFVSCAVWSGNRKQRRPEKFAAAEGITYQWKPSPIALPAVVYERYRRAVSHNATNSITDVYCVLYGLRRGVDVFACNIQVGWGRGNTDVLSMVAAR